MSPILSSFRWTRMFRYPQTRPRVIVLLNKWQVLVPRGRKMTLYSTFSLALALKYLWMALIRKFKVSNPLSRLVHHLKRLPRPLLRQQRSKFWHNPNLSPP
jgi:ABC-type transport system involved in cytochrome c biogenesis permease subunit